MTVGNPLCCYGFPAGQRMQLDQLKRRQFITLLGGAMAWPLAAHAQQRERMRRIGVLMSATPDDPEANPPLGVPAGAPRTGWTIGRNVRIDFRWGAGNPDLFRKYATELVALAPDVILATAGRSWGRYSRRPAPCRSCSRDD